MAMVSHRLLDVAVTTCIAAMNGEQLERFSATLADPEKNQGKISSIAAEIPGLQAAIEQAYLREYEVLKGSFVL